MIIEAAFAANMGEEQYCTHFMGTKGGAETNPLRIFAEECGTLVDKKPAYIPRIENSHEIVIRAFYDAIHNDTEPLVTGEQALDVIKILDAIYKSSETGREVLID